MFYVGFLWVLLFLPHLTTAVRTSSWEHHLVLFSWPWWTYWIDFRVLGSGCYPVFWIRCVWLHQWWSYGLITVYTFTVFLKVNSNYSSRWNMHTKGKNMYCWEHYIMTSHNAGSNILHGETSFGWLSQIINCGGCCNSWANSMDKYTMKSRSVVDHKKCDVPKLITGKVWDLFIYF